VRRFLLFTVSGLRRCYASTWRSVFRLRHLKISSAPSRIPRNCNGGINLGDEAILQVILAQLRESFPMDVTVFTRDAEDTLSRHNVSRAVQFGELSRREAQDIIAGSIFSFSEEVEFYTTSTPTCTSGKYSWPVRPAHR
jgi:hypothetical protein